jgi:hypothetical protein
MREGERERESRRDDDLEESKIIRNEEHLGDGRGY